MSKRYRVKKTQTAYLWNPLPEEEKMALFEMCAISDQIIREDLPGVSPDDAIDAMTEDGFKKHDEQVMDRLRKRKKALKKAIEEGVYMGYTAEVITGEEEIKTEEQMTEEEKATAEAV